MQFGYSDRLSTLAKWRFVLGMCFVWQTQGTVTLRPVLWMCGVLMEQ